MSMTNDDLRRMVAIMEWALGTDEWERPMSDFSDAELDEIRVALDQGDTLVAQRAILAGMERSA